jgi:hypothetical protein
LITILIFPVHGKILSQTKVYKMVDQTTSADINPNLYRILFESARPVSLTTKPFMPVKGKFTVYRFIATYQGLSFTNKEKEFHDILIVKTDRKNKIIVSYQYTLEWTDSPEADLFKSTCKDTYLTDKMLIEKFRFQRKKDYANDDAKLIEQAIISF